MGHSSLSPAYYQPESPFVPHVGLTLLDLNHKQNRSFLLPINLLPKPSLWDLPERHSVDSASKFESKTPENKQSEDVRWVFQVISRAVVLLSSQYHLPQPLVILLLRCSDSWAPSQFHSPRVSLHSRSLRQKPQNTPNCLFIQLTTSPVPLKPDPIFFILSS